jgi:integral membrane protein (TIGR01906 family)
MMDVTEDRHDLQPEVDMDESQDTDEPAFDWMKTPQHRAAPSSTAEAADPDRLAHTSAPTAAASSSDAAEDSSSAERSADRPSTEREDAHLEPSPTTALQMRPPEDEVRRRTAQREAAAKAKPVAPRVLQVLMAIFLPFLLLIAAVRLVATPAFLWLEYFRPGFPGDGYGFSGDDRLTYGSYAVDYLGNFAGRRYLGDLVQPSGSALFTDAEVSHMADVKNVVLLTYAAGLLLLVFFVVSYLVLRKRRGAFGRGLFAGSIVTFVLVVGLAILAVLGWDRFFTDFHRIFFSQGNWTFQLSDTLIRLFPGQFWIDSAIVIGVLTLLVSSLIIIFAWPTKRSAEDLRQE